MTGFIRGLFGGKKEAAAPKAQPKPQPQKVAQEGTAFYLDPDDAKTYGNIDYMRSAKTVRRTFARKKGETAEKESIRQISAMEAVRMRENGVPEPNPSGFSQVVSSGKVEEAAKFTRRQADSSLDTFRNMAKDMKK